MADDLSVLSLRDVITAKLDHKLRLLAEIEAIDQDLRRAYEVLREVPSLTEKTPSPKKQVVVPHTAKVKPVKVKPWIHVRKCQRTGCTNTYMGSSNAKYCEECRSIIRGEIITATRKRMGREFYDRRWQKKKTS